MKKYELTKLDFNKEKVLIELETLEYEDPSQIIIEINETCVIYNKNCNTFNFVDKKEFRKIGVELGIRYEGFKTYKYYLHSVHNYLDLLIIYTGIVKKNNDYSQLSINTLIKMVYAGIMPMEHLTVKYLDKYTLSQVVKRINPKYFEKDNAKFINKEALMSYVKYNKLMLTTEFLVSNKISIDKLDIKYWNHLLIVKIENYNHISIMKKYVDEDIYMKNKEVIKNLKKWMRNENNIGKVIEIIRNNDISIDILPSKLISKMQNMLNDNDLIMINPFTNNNDNQNDIIRI